MNSAPTIAESAKIFEAIPRDKLFREDFGGETVYRCDIPTFWTPDLRLCIQIGSRVEAGWGFPYGSWGQNPAMIVDAVDIYRTVVAAWREENGR